MFENMAKQMIQQKQLRSNTSFEEELDMEKRKDEFRSYQKRVRYLMLKVTKAKKKHGRCYEWKRLKKNPNKIVDEVHKERNGTENANDSQMMTILSTILENGKKRDENLVAWVTNMENELQESQYDNDFECFDDDQTYDENSNVQYVKNNVKNSDNTSLKRKKIDQIEKLFRETRVGFQIWVNDLKQRNMWN